MEIGTGTLVIFMVILPVLSFLYASVGHGGASGYLALMSLFSFPNEMMKQTALLLNLFVAAVAFYHYQKAGHFRKDLFWPFALASIPAAFLGGLTELEPGMYKKILGVLLVFAVVRMLWQSSERDIPAQWIRFVQAFLLGAFVGFFSGLIGIGGGIILTPIILLLHWGNMKEAAAVSALFIWVNSAAGLIGQFTSGVELLPVSGLMVFIAVLGGLAGSYLGSKKWPNGMLKYTLATVLLTASFKLLFL